MSNAAAIIEKVMGQKPRTGAWLPGARTNLPYAQVEERNGDLLFVHGETEETAMSKLLDFVRKRHPMLTRIAEEQEAGIGPAPVNGKGEPVVLIAGQFVAVNS